MEHAIRARYTASQHRLFLLDYDGTLVGIKPTPPEAKPTEALKALLADLAADAGNTVVIISGRDHETLEAWLGDLPIAMVAEHGFFRKEQGSTAWQMVTAHDARWKTAVTPLIEAAVSELPGSFMEEKVSSLVWHYRLADEAAAEPVVRQLTAQLQPVVAAHGLLVVPGKKVVEVRLAGYDKGVAAEHWLQTGRWDFVLAAGDDTTDEDLFRPVPVGDFTIKLGAGASIARYHLADPEALLQLLATLRRPEASATPARPRD